MLYIDFLKFSENQDKEFQLEPMHFQLHCCSVSIVDFEWVNARCDITNRTFASEKIFYTSTLTCEQSQIYFRLI